MSRISSPLRRTVIVAVIVASLAAVHSLSATAGARKGNAIVLFYGGPLKERVLMRDTVEVMQFFKQLFQNANGEQDTASIDIAARDQHTDGISMRLFMGAEFLPYVNGTKPASALDTADSGMGGTLLPSRSGAPAVFVMMGPTRRTVAPRIGPQALAILRKHGIPMELPK